LNSEDDMKKHLDHFIHHSLKYYNREDWLNTEELVGLAYCYGGKVDTVFNKRIDRSYSKNRERILDEIVYMPNDVHFDYLISYKN